MYASLLSRSALAGSLLIGCWAGIGTAVMAAPADVRVVAPAPDSGAEKSSDATGAGSQFELTFWQSVSSSEDADQLQAYLARYPNGTFSGLARAKIAALSRHSAAPSAGATPSAAAPVTPPAASAAIMSKADAVPPAKADDGDLVGSAAAIPGAAEAVVRTPVPAAQGAAPAKPASVPAKVVKLAPLPPQPVEAAPAAAAVSVSTTASTTAGSGASVPPSLAQQLRALGQSQGHRPEPVAAQQSDPPALAHSQSPALQQSEPAALQQSDPPMPQQLIAIPSRPKLANVPKVDLPDHFCTTMERHDFYNAVYQPARRIADQNDRTATGHMLKLQSIYDDYAQRQDQAATDAIAVEVRDYEALASDAHHASTAFENMFDSLMTVPVRECGETL